MSNGDLISRQAVIDIIHEFFKAEVDEAYKNLAVASASNKVNRILKNNAELCKKIKNIPSKNSWIPIGQFPTEPCLLIFEDETMAVGYYDEADDLCISVGDSYYCSAEEAIAWQPLPDVYKERE